VGEVLHGSLLKLLFGHCDFLNIDILQGSVATRLRCGGICKYELVANLPVSLLVKEFWKSVNIWGSYGQEFGVLFFSETQCICVSPNVVVLVGYSVGGLTTNSTNASLSLFVVVTSVALLQLGQLLLVDLQHTTYVRAFRETVNVIWCV